jgi:hypothetical protein
MHCRGVSNHVRRNPSVAEAWARNRCAVSEAAQQEGNTVTGKAVCTRIGERQAATLVTELLKPGSQDLCCFGPKGDGAFFAPLTVQFQRGWRIKQNITTADRDDLRNAGAAVV